MVSVLIPAYNAENTLHRCLKSVLSQTMTDIEIILVNDGSDDSTPDILQEYIRKDQRVKVIDQPNQGVAAARNTALKTASGEYFLFVDADDWIEPDMLEKMLDLMGDADIVFCKSDHAGNSEEAQHVSLVKIELWNHSRQLIEFMRHERMSGMLWNKLIRRSTAEGCSFNPKTGYGEDAEFLWQVLKRSRKMVVTNEILYHHTLEETSISHLSFSSKKYSAIPMWENINREVKKYYPKLLPLARERLMCAAVFSLYECRSCGYKNIEQIKHMRSIVRKYAGSFLKSKNVSKKFKLYTIAVCLGY